MSDLARFAAHPEDTRGRLYRTDASPTRSEYQRDRDRIIHSTAFRRLQHKTQVFLHHEGQHFRTRLTHTLEVSQIARSMARALQLNEDLAEAVALAHDLGHTPFGHAGERVLHAKMQPWGGFDHNIQALRVVTMLENRYAEHDGLNLTWETLEGILKHNGPLVDESGAPVGRYARTGLPWGLEDIPASVDLRMSTFATLEAQAAAIADDIAYNGHDIDDALRAGLITFDELRDVPLVGPLVTEVLSLWPHIETARQAHEVQRRLITRSIVDVIDTANAALAELRPQTTEDIRLAGRTIVRFSAETAEAEQGLKRFMFDHVYRNEAVMAPIRKSQDVLGALFDLYIAGSPMPGRWAIAFGGVQTEAGRARIVADFMAGMTDPYALEEFTRLFDGQG